MGTPKNIGRYEIIEELGHGAMGTVYRAKDPAMDRVVALKTIIAVALVSSQGTEFRERFYREARAAGKLAHPGIVPVFDVGEHEGLPFLVMEFVDGRTLEDAAKSGERLTLERVCEIGQQTAEALAYAHRNGVVHRDIKPANILMTSVAKHGIERPKITDFGVAKLAAGSTTMSGQILGTPAYMPPEQFTGSAVDGRADIFSLGVILYWLATGEQPFPGETLTAVSYKVVHTEPVPPAKLNPSVPPGLEKIILKCIAKSPAARYQTGEELARELAGLRGGKNSASLEKTAMRVPLPVETDATIDFHAASQSASVAAPRRVVEAPPAAKKGNWFVPALVLVAALLAGGWYILRGRHSSEAKALSSPTATTAPATVAPPISNVAAPLAAPPVSTPAKPVTATPKKSVGGSETETPAKISKPAAVVSEEPPALAIDPKSLDPNANAKLKIDPPHAPDSVEFLVEMNGKKFYQWNGSGDRSEYKNLLVPPGVNEFRVIGRSNGTQVTSNIVSAEFKAKKHKTLKIELRNQPKPSHDAPTPPLSPESQLFVTLK